MSASTTTGLDERVAGVLCYSVWWITGGLFLVLERQHRTIRFHAAQSLVLFGAISALLIGLAALSVLALVLSSATYQVMRVFGELLWVGAAVLWLVLVLRAWRGEVWRVPLAGGERRKVDLKADNMTAFSVHPDGRRIAFGLTGPARDHEIWVLENFLAARSAAKDTARK